MKQATFTIAVIAFVCRTAVGAQQKSYVNRRVNLLMLTVRAAEL